MTETRKPYTVESFKAGKKAETRDGRIVKGLNYNRSRECFFGYTAIETRTWLMNGKHEDSGAESIFDLFEKEEYEQN
jgi:hypothetical protein